MTSIQSPSIYNYNLQSMPLQEHVRIQPQDLCLEEIVAPGFDISMTQTIQYQKHFKAINEAFRAYGKEPRFDSFTCYLEHLNGEYQMQALKYQGDYVGGISYIESPSWLKDRSWFSDEFAYFGELWVHPSYTGNKLSENLISKVEDKVKALGKKYMIIYVDREKEMLLHFYEKKGYEDLENLVPEYQNSSPFYRMLAKKIA